MNTKDPIACTNPKGHYFKDVGFNLAQCKFCGLSLMHGGQFDIDAINENLRTLVDVAWHPREDFQIPDDAFTDNSDPWADDQDGSEPDADG